MIQSEGSAIINLDSISVISKQSDQDVYFVTVASNTFVISESEYARLAEQL
jgi:hypothetical protein